MTPQYLHYIGLVLLLGIIVSSFFFLIIEPHNFMANQKLDRKEEREHSYDYANFKEAAHRVSNVQDNSQRELLTNFKSGKITEEQYIETSLLLTSSSEYYEQYRDDEPNSTQAQRDLYIAAWALEEGRFLTNYYTYFNCVDNTISTVRKYNHLLYYLKYEDKQEVLALKELLLKRTEFNFPLKERRDDIGNLQYNAEVLYEKNSVFDFDVRWCENFNAYITTDYNYQSKLAVVRIFILILGSIFFFSIGKVITWHRVVLAFNVTKNSTQRTPDLIKQIFNPPIVKEKTIKQILALSSVVAIISMVVTLFVNIFRSNGWVVFSIGITSLTLLLLGLITGIMAINTGKSPQRKVSYYLFLFGMILFTFFLLVFVLKLNFEVISSAAKQAANMFLNNQTIV